MFFSEIIGQEKVKQRLIKSVQEERISHAQLFSGPEGTGKLALAIAYAQFISCRNRTDTDSCGVCPSCHKYSKLIHPDLHFVFPIFKPKDSSKSVWCDQFLSQWRTLILKSPYFSLNQWMDVINAENQQAIIYANESDFIFKKLNLKPYEAEFKVMIIWLPEKMHISCANKLLKLIEEPPFKTLFLFVSEDEGGIIPTILSRTQVIKVPGIDDPAMQEALRSTGKFSPGSIAEMVHLANGNYLKALESEYPGEDKIYHFEAFQKIMRHAWKGEVLELMGVAEDLADKGREQQKDFFSYALQLTREYFILNLNKPSLVFLTNNEKEWGTRFSPFINERNIVPLNKVFEDGFLHISMNGNPKIVFTDALLTIVRLIRR
jgi:DNA polymerase III subunit delta'